MVKEASQTAKDAGILARDLHAETKPVLLLQQSLKELRKAARSLRDFSDFVQRNPESLIFGKPNPP